MKPMPCIVCGQSAILAFISGRLLYKQEAIFLRTDIQKKVWESHGGEKKYRICVTVKYMKCKSEGLRENIGTRYFPRFAAGLNMFLHVSYLSF